MRRRSTEAEGCCGAASASGAPGRFQLEAAVQSVHAARRLTGTTDWEAIVVLYDALFALTGFAGRRRQSRGGGLAMRRGRGGAQVAGRGRSAGRARRVRTLLGRARRPLRQIGDVEEARRAYGLAIGLQTDPAARAFLIERLAALV